MKSYTPEDYSWTIHTVQITLQVYDEIFIVENQFGGNCKGAEVLSLIDDPDFMWGAVKVIKGKIIFDEGGLIVLYFDGYYREFTSEELLDYVVKVEIVGVKEVEHS